MATLRPKLPPLFRRSNHSATGRAGFFSVAGKGRPATGRKVSLECERVGGGAAMR